jgi:UDP-N-acetylglucosamine diphosphorylase / glucose-1-phosphate thymidylyltransferase / UDP-N-acetylgalactosamine diphosphorylase / glucosamine-1-phosphate N-acetyltransferase / galactosamine-1-phosphate N-acetyltransferase
VSALILYDDERARGFEPFASTRPLGEMMAGAALIRERWERALGVRCTGFVSRESLAGFDEEGASAFAATAKVDGEVIVALTRFVPQLARPASDGGAVSRWTHDGETVAVRVREGTDLGLLHDGRESLDRFEPASPRSVEIEGWMLERVWDLVGYLPEMLASDVGGDSPAAAGGRTSAALPSLVSVIGNGKVHLGRGVTIDPMVVFDTSAGGIVIADGATIHSFARIVGPCYIGRKSTVLGGDVTSCGIGPVCKVRGEISVSVMLGYANKGHDGFVGHSYLGRWVNLGAGTITSNLKNTYSQVEMWTPEGERSTGLQFLGTMFGDHAKTGIGLSLTTGTVIGTGANVFETMPPKTVAPFSWGSRAPYTDYRLDKFLEVAERVMGRRSVELTDGMRRVLSEAHASRWTVEEKSAG